MKKEKGYVMLILWFNEKTTEEAAKKEVKNYIRRVRSYRQTRGMKLTLQYIFGVNVKAAQNLCIILMSKINAADAAALWKNGMSIVRGIDTNENTPQCIAEDMWGHCPGAEWTCSKGLRARYLKHVMKYLEKGVAA